MFFFAVLEDVSDDSDRWDRIPLIYILQTELVKCSIFDYNSY